MWDTPETISGNSPETSTIHLSHDRPCAVCGHAMHTFLACSDSCDCRPLATPGVAGLVA